MRIVVLFFRPGGAAGSGQLAGATRPPVTGAGPAAAAELGPRWPYCRPHRDAGLAGAGQEWCGASAEFDSQAGEQGQPRPNQQQRWEDVVFVSKYGLGL